VDFGNTTCGVIMMDYVALGILFKLICIHALTDFALQPDCMGVGKNPKLTDKFDENLCKHDVSYKRALSAPWQYWMIAHCLIYAGGVYLVTNMVVFSILTVVVHFVLDYAKCMGHIYIHEDQICHVFWLMIAMVVTCW
jgi:hypothetical protein